MMDENFLLNRPRAMQLLNRMKKGGKSWSLYVFSSANAIRKYSIEELVQLGVSWIWLGLESPKSSYAKLHNTDTHVLASELRQHGIKLLGSTIVGWNITRWRTFARKSSLPSRTGPTFTSSCSTRQSRARRCFSRCRTKAACSTASISPTFTDSSNSTSSTPPSRATIPSACSTGVSLRLRTERPEPVRICDTIFQGWKKYHDHPICGCGSAWPMKPPSCAPPTTPRSGDEKRLKKTNFAISIRIRELRREIEHEFGGATRLVRAITGRFCCGHRDAKTGSSRRARPTSRQRLSIGGTGRRKQPQLRRVAASPTAKCDGPHSPTMTALSPTRYDRLPCLISPRKAQ